MKIWVRSLLFWILLVAGCGTSLDSPVRPDALTSIIGSASAPRKPIMPLAVGNRWVYANHEQEGTNHWITGYEIIEIVRQTEENGKKVFWTQTGDRLTEEFSGLWQSNSSFVAKYPARCGQIFGPYSMNVYDWDTHQYININTIREVVSTDTPIVVEGTLYHTCVYHTRVDDWRRFVPQHNDMDVYYAPGIGMVFGQTYGTYKTLVEVHLE